MKKILITVESLGSGGVEVSLIRFLNVISKNKNLKIDLLLMKKEGVYLSKVPKNITIRELKLKDDMYNYDNKFSYIKKLNGFDKLKYLFIRIKLNVFLKLKKYDLYYNEFLNKVIPIEEKYDMAIDYLGYGHFTSAYVAKKVNAKKKCMWIHDEKNDWLCKIEKIIDDFDKVFAVGRVCMNAAIVKLPKLKDKIDVFYNMSDYEGIIKKSNEKINDVIFDTNKFNIITVGRLEWQKGYDVAIETARILKEKNINFCWNVIGGGTKLEELKQLVFKNELTDNFRFLGTKTNPYPYIKKSDVFVLTSRHEGYCLAILEAKVLKKVIVATDIESNREQIKNGINGILSKLDPIAFSNSIIEVIKNKELYDKIIKNLNKENLDFTSEFDKLYNLLEFEENVK